MSSREIRKERDASAGLGRGSCIYRTTRRSLPRVLSHRRLDVYPTERTRERGRAKSDSTRRRRSRPPRSPWCRTPRRVRAGKSSRLVVFPFFVFGHRQKNEKHIKGGLSLLVSTVWIWRHYRGRLFRVPSGDLCDETMLEHESRSSPNVSTHTALCPLCQSSLWNRRTTSFGRRLTRLTSKPRTSKSLSILKKKKQTRGNETNQREATRPLCDAKVSNAMDRAHPTFGDDWCGLLLLREREREREREIRTFAYVD